MKRIAAIIAVLLLLPLVSAELVVNKYTNDFTLSSPSNEQLKLCSCETRVDTLLVENTGQFPSDYRVTIDSDYPRTLRIAEPAFSLAPKHNAQVPVYIEDSCGVQGTYRYLVTVTNSYGRIEQLERTIRADACQTGALDVSQDVTVGLCEPAAFTVTARNVGTYAESFSLDFGPYDANATDMFLQPGEQRTQDVRFTWACTEYGDRTVPFTLIAAKGGPQATTTRDVTIRNEYAFSLDLRTAADACTKVTTTVPVTVTNDADVPDEITLTVDGPASFDGRRESTLALGPHESREVGIAMQPVMTGRQDITIDAADTYGGITKTRTLALDVADCYEPAVEIRMTPEQPLVGADVDCCGPKTYYVNVRNDGDREQAFRLSLNGPSVFTLDELTVRVRPSENVNVPIRAELPCTDERYEATVTVWPDGQPHVNVSATLAVDSWSTRACYQVQIDEDELTVRDDASVVPVIVRHTGLRGGNYTIMADSDVFGFRETAIELQPGEEKAIHMTPSLNLSEQEKGRYLVRPGFTEDVQGIQYDESIGVQLRGKGLIERFLDWLFGLSLAGWSVCARIVLFLGIALVVLIAVLLLIYLGKVAIFRDGLSRHALAVIKTVIVILAVLLLLTLAFLRAPAREASFERMATSEGTVLEWYQNERYELDLAPYFDDPDNDTLAFTASQPGDIRAEIDGSWLTLTPDHNFAGENALVVTASDSKGGIADSPTFTLRVIPRKQLTCAQWTSLWCSHLVTLHLIAILVVLFLIVLTIRERRQDLQRDNVIVVVPAAKRTAKRSVKRSARKSSKRIVKSRKVVRRSSSRTKASAKYATTRALARQSGVEVMTPTRVQRFGPSPGQTVNIAVGNPAPAMLAVPGAKASEIIYVGSKDGDKVHTPYCMVARRIPKAKRVAYGSKREAMNAGLIPCKMCRPFEGGI